MRNGVERRHLERTLASGIEAQNKKGARVMRTPSPEHKLMLFSSVLCNLSCNSFFSNLFRFAFCNNSSRHFRGRHEGRGDNGSSTC